jgi:hypothetical protein
MLLTGVNIMAINSLNDPLSNQKNFDPHISLRDKLHEELRQARALICLANGQEFLELDRLLQHDYLVALENLILAAVRTYSSLDKTLDSCH